MSSDSLKVNIVESMRESAILIGLMAIINYQKLADRDFLKWLGIFFLANIFLKTTNDSFDKSFIGAAIFQICSIYLNPGNKK